MRCCLLLALLQAVTAFNVAALPLKAAASRTTTTTMLMPELMPEPTALEAATTLLAKTANDQLLDTALAAVWPAATAGGLAVHTATVASATNCHHRHPRP